MNDQGASDPPAVTSAEIREVYDRVATLIADRDILLRDVAALRARLAEVERERDARTTWDVFGGCLGQETQRRKAAEAKLAAVRDRLKTAGVLTVDFAWRDELLALIDEEVPPGRGPLMDEVMVRIQRFDPQQLTMDSPRGNWVTLGPAMTEAEAVEALKGYRRRDRASNRSYQYRIAQ